MHIGTSWRPKYIVLRSVFFELGGFEGLPLPEDVKFSSKLRDYGNVSVITPKIKSLKENFLGKELRKKIKNMYDTSISHWC